MLVARNIEAAMTRKGTNAAEVARRAGINPTGVYDILNGKSLHPRLDTINKIAKGIGVPLAVLFAEPSEDELDQQISEEIGMLGHQGRRRILGLARALRETDDEGGEPPSGQ